MHILCINVIRRKRGVGLCLALLIAADFYLHKDKGCFSFLLLVSPFQFSSLQSPESTVEYHGHKLDTKQTTGILEHFVA